MLNWKPALLITFYYSLSLLTKLMQPPADILAMIISSSLSLMPSKQHHITVSALASSMLLTKVWKLALVMLLLMSSSKTTLSSFLSLPSNRTPDPISPQTSLAAETVWRMLLSPLRMFVLSTKRQLLGEPFPLLHLMRRLIRMALSSWPPLPP